MLVDGQVEEMVTLTQRTLEEVVVVLLPSLKDTHSCNVLLWLLAQVEVVEPQLAELVAV